MSARQSFKSNCMILAFSSRAAAFHPKIERLIHSCVTWHSPASASPLVALAVWLFVQANNSRSEVNSFIAEKSRPVKCSLWAAFPVCALEQTFVFVWTWLGAFSWWRQVTVMFVIILRFCDFNKISGSFQSFESKVRRAPNFLKS